jgi:hypothetical protein
MADLKLPPSPFGFSCDRCRHWLADEAKNMVILPTGNAVPIAEMVKAGQPMPDNLLRARMGPCTAFPTWTNTASCHWCGAFEAAKVQ